MKIKNLYKLNRDDREKLVQTYIDAFKYYPKLMNAFPDANKKDAALEATLRFYESMGFYVIGVARSEEFGFVNTYLLKDPK